MFQFSKQGSVDVVTGEGPLTTKTVDAFSAVLARCCQSGTPRVVVDLSGVPLLDSSGIESLLHHHEESRSRGGKLCLAAPNRLVQDVLDISEVSAVIQIFSCTTTAVGSFVR